MKKILFTLLIAAVFSGAKSQITFQKTYSPLDPDGFALHGISATPDGGYAMVGACTSNNNPHDVYFQKINAHGDTVFTRSYGSPEHEAGYSITTCNDSGFFMAGYTEYFSNGNDLYLVRTDKWGDTLWTRGLGDPAGAAQIAQEVAQTADGNLLVFGTQSKFEGNFFLAKLSNTGNLLWKKSYGGIHHDWGFDMSTTSDNGIIMTGFASSFNNTDTNVFVVKTDSVGSVEWAKTYGSPGIDIGNGIKQTYDGGYIVAGTTMNFGGLKIYLIKLTATGDTVWSKVYNTPIYMDYFIYKNVILDVTPDNGFVMCFTKYTLAGVYDMGLLRTDSTGNIIWFKTYGTANGSEGHAVMATADGGIIAAGIAYGTYVVKTDASGNSGCNETTDTTSVINLITTVTTVTPGVTSAGVTKTLPSAMGSGATVSVLCASTGVEDLNLNSLSPLTIAPNPADEYIEVKIPENLYDENGVLTIYDMQGKAIKSLPFKNYEGKPVYIGDIESGVYVVQLVFTHSLSVTRFVKH